jgi:hypothetical protein
VDSAVVGIVDEVRTENDSESSSYNKRAAAVAGKSKH